MTKASEAFHDIDNADDKLFTVTDQLTRNIKAGMKILTASLWEISPRDEKTLESQIELCWHNSLVALKRSDKPHAYSDAVVAGFGLMERRPATVFELRRRFGKNPPPKPDMMVHLIAVDRGDHEDECAMELVEGLIRRPATAGQTSLKFLSRLQPSVKNACLRYGAKSVSFTEDGCTRDAFEIPDLARAIRTGPAPEKQSPQQNPPRQPA